jgi:hypothetical protein
MMHTDSTWVLLIISIDNGNINVYDSLRKHRSEYQDLEDVFHEYSIYDIFFNAIYIFSFYTNIFYLLLFCLKAWIMFIAKHQGAFQPKIIWVYDFPVRIQTKNSDWEYLKCITLQFHIMFSSPI